MKKLLLGFVMLVAATSMYGQGCSQCRDSMEQTPAPVRAAYRQAIYLMAGGAAMLFTAVFVVARRMR